MVTGQAMLYPIQQKDLYLDPWFDLFKSFKKHLAEKQIWIVIGYSFHDPFIKEIFREALSEDRRMIIVDPKAKSIKKDLFNFDNVSTLPYEFHENNTPMLIAEEIK
jgi:SIR2-like domain